MIARYPLGNLFQKLLKVFVLTTATAEEHFYWMYRRSTPGDGYTNTLIDSLF